MCWCCNNEEFEPDEDDLDNETWPVDNDEPSEQFAPVFGWPGHVRLDYTTNKPSTSSGYHNAGFALDVEIATASTIKEKITMSPEDKIEFITLLLSDDAGALTTVEAFLEAAWEPAPTFVNHTIWSRGVPDENGFRLYHVNHNLGSTNVAVAVDDFRDFTFSIRDENTVVLVSSEDLFGVDVTVEVK